MMFGLPQDTPVKDLVSICRTIFTKQIAPVTVETGPVKENIIKGDDIDLLSLPVPKWNRLDGGRYILTYAGCVTKDPDTELHNVGIYRGMVASKNQIPVLLWRAQHWGGHFSKHQQAGDEMPVAFVIGWEPSLGFTAGAPVPRAISEYDTMGAIRGEPVDLIECETVPLMVPSNAEIVKSTRKLVSIGASLVLYPKPMGWKYAGGTLSTVCGLAYLYVLKRRKLNAAAPGAGWEAAK